MVWLGEPQPAPAADQSGQDAQKPFGKHPDVFASPDHQRGDGGHELEDSNDQIQCARVSELRQLQDSNPVLLRKAGTLPIMNPEDRFKETADV